MFMTALPHCMLQLPDPLAALCLVTNHAWLLSGAWQLICVPHPAMVISKGKVSVWEETTGGMWSLLSLTLRRMAVKASSTPACSLACLAPLTAAPPHTHYCTSLVAFSGPKPQALLAAARTVLDGSLAEYA